MSKTRKVGRVSADPVKQPVTARQTRITIPTYSHHAARRLPRLFTGVEYPYTKDDILGGPKCDVEYEALVLENEHLKLTVLPHLGGKLWSAYDKNAGEEAIYVPDVIKPGLIALSGAWIPGGMEFNFPRGHQILSMRPWPCAIVESGPEQAAILATRRCLRTGLQMQVRIGLRAGEARFDLDFTLMNPTHLRHGWSFWNNVGILAHDDWRFLSKAKWYYTGSRAQRYPFDSTGVDTSYYRNRQFCSDSFMLAHCEDFFGCYDYRRDHGVAHIAPWQEARGKKYFTWGTSKYRYSDSERIFSDSDRNYVEIQIGVRETQGHKDMLEPGDARMIHTTWIPFRKLGGMDWANRDAIFHVKDGVPWAYAAVSTSAVFVFNGRSQAVRLKAGVPVKLSGGPVEEGTDIEIHLDGTLARRFRYPFEGRQEPGGEKRVMRELHGHYRQGSKAVRAMRGGERAMLCEHFASARDLLRSALKADPRLHEARLLLGETLWHMGDFEAGAAQCRSLLKTKLASEARAMLARQPGVEREFMAPVSAVPDGFGRDLTLAERYAGYGNAEASFREYKKLLRKDPDNSRVHYGLASYYSIVASNAKRARHHAERALALKPGDRDLIIELMPILMKAGAYERVAELYRTAPKSIRKLSVVQKMAASVFLQLEDFDACWRIVSKVHLFNWEGEFWHVDVYIDCALALAERALAAGNLKQARRMVDAARTLPPNLGVPRRTLALPKVGYWHGLITKLEKGEEEARRVWRGVLEECEQERAVVEVIGGKSWPRWLPDDETIYLWGLMAICLDDRAWTRRVAKTMKQIHRLRGQSDWMKGLVAELEEDFETAKQHFLKAAKPRKRPYMLRRHLAAVSRRRRRGELPV